MLPGQYEAIYTRQDEENILASLVRDCFGTEEVYLGGSAALKKFLYESPKISVKDLDFFVYKSPTDTPATWATMGMLGVHARVVLAGDAYSGKYKIPGQYKFYKIKLLTSKYDVSADIILIDPAHASLEDTAGSSLALAFYKLQYGRSPVSDIVPAYYRQKLLRAIQTDMCVSIYDSCTPKHAEKVKKRAIALGLTVRYEHQAEREKSAKKWLDIVEVNRLLTTMPTPFNDRF